jgi:hypothetical protein
MSCAAIFTFMMLPTALAFAEEMPLDVGSRKQLFIDQRFVAQSERVVLRTNPGQKLGQVLDAQGNPLMGHVSRVIEDQGKIRMYVGHEGVTIFESDDGQHFRATGNSIGGGSFSTIFLDPHDTNPARRYKLFLLKSQPTFDRTTDGVYAFTSADGLHFTEVGRVLPCFTDNPTIVLWDQRINKYVIYLRALAYDSPNQRRIARIEVDDPLKPWPFRESKDPRPFLSTENLYDEHGRHDLALRGQRTVYDESGKATSSEIPQAKGAPWFKLEQWHEYHLVCKGPHLTLKVDGRLVAEVIDNDPKQRDLSGILGLQLHTGPPTTVQFKDIQLKILKSADKTR